MNLIQKLLNRIYPKGIEKLLEHREIQLQPELSLQALVVRINEKKIQEITANGENGH